ncbi:MAG: SDR family oxidoreductase [Candidatus Rokubacteria bacterium]|nr:SDR family oxidoreductase [Candidatus Rokubacteria bacterium]
MQGRQDGRLGGMVAIVTGSARNIGRAIALALAEEGTSIVVNGLGDRAAAEGVTGEIVAAGGRAIVQMGDVTREADALALAGAAVKAFGRVDFLISNAAVRKQTPFLEMTLEEWHRVLAVPLDGAFLCARAAVPHMIRAGGGAIVTLGGISAHLGTRDRAHVCAAKAGLVGLTHALAMELAPHKIRVNCVAPGAVDTVRGTSAGARPSGTGAANIPLGRMGRPEEVAAIVRQLCLPDGAYVTGQTIHVNGGAFLS